LYTTTRCEAGGDSSGGWPNDEMQKHGDRRVVLGKRDAGARVAGRAPLPRAKIHIHFPVLAPPITQPCIIRIECSDVR
jgi:hypothetical protein